MATSAYRYDRRAVRNAVKAAGGAPRVAKAGRLSPSAVRYWAHGSVVPSAENLARLATATGVPPGEFFKQSP